MSIIDTSYFVKDISIPVGSLSNLTNEIVKYEPEVLTMLLGYELYKLTLSEASQRMTDLLTGKEYTVSYNGRDQLIKWNGFSNTELISLIAYYTYYCWQRNNQTHTSKTGENKPNQENSMIASGGIKAAAAWSRMRELYGYNLQSVLIPSCYNFLMEHESDYPELLFTEIGQINTFDL